MDSYLEEKIQYSPNKQDINLTDDLISVNSTKSKIYSKDVYIYSWGKNKYGELGLNTAKNTYIPTAIKTLKSSIIKSVKSGGRNTILLTSDGQILMCGSNIFNLLAINTKFLNNEQYQKTFKLVKYFEENNEEKNETIKEIAIAEFHSLALNNNGEVYGWGGNLYNKLGQSNGLCGLPSKIYIKRKIVSIACGDYHSCALSENGVLYSWGGGGESYNKGQCGHGSKKDVEYPKKVEFFTKKGLHVIKISCGGYHTIAMDEKNQLYGFGKGIFGQCGYGHTEDAVSPKKIIFQENNKIIDIKCGGEHSIFLSNNGKVYACGHGYFGQLGLGNNKNIKYPLLVQSLSNKNVIEIDAGWSHTLVLTNERNVYAAGCGKFGELGLGDNKNKYNYTWIKKLGPMNVKHIFAGGHHSWCIIDNKCPLKERFVEPEPLEKPNFIMNKRKLSDNSDKNDLSFDDKNNHRNRGSNTVDYKNRRPLDDNLDNYMDTNHNRINSFDNNEILHNQELKKMIDDYNDEKNNLSNNLDNLIDRFENINNTDMNNKNNTDKFNDYDNFNNNEDEDNYIRNQNNDSQFNDKNNNNFNKNNDDNNYKDDFNSNQNNMNNNEDEDNYIRNQNNDSQFNDKNNNNFNENNDDNNYKDDFNSNQNNKNNNEDDFMNNNINDEDYIRNNFHDDNKNKNSLNNKDNNQLNNSKGNNKNNINEFNDNDNNKNNKNNLNNDRNSDIYNNKNKEDSTYKNNKNKNTNKKTNKNYDQFINANKNKYPNDQNKNKNIPNNNNIYNNNNSKKNKNYDIFSKKNNDSLLYLKNINKNKIQLQVIFSELNLSHRFIRFTISSTNKYYKLDFKSLNNMISKYLSFDKGNISFKLQDDREVLKGGKKAINPMMDNLLKEMKDSGLFNTENKNKINYTIAIVYDYNKSSMLRQVYEEFKENYNEKNISYINFKIVNENQIKNGKELEGILSKWTIDFYEHFKEMFIYYEDDDINLNVNINNFGENNIKVLKPRFLEMRPKIFK